MQTDVAAVERLITQAGAYLDRKQYARAEATVLSAFAKFAALTQTAASAAEKKDEKPAGLPSTPAKRTSIQEKEAALREFLEANLFGQPEAIDAGVCAYLHSIAPIKRPDQPLSVVLSLGRSRTGKSELPRLLAQHLHGDKRALVRVDLSQYQESHQVATLIGSPPGYVGYYDAPKFCRETLEKSRGTSHNQQIILVLEEFEKAHQAVADTLLGVFDNGEAELANGQTVNFRDVIIFMTSNLAAKELSSLGKSFVGFAPAHQQPSDNQVSAEVNRVLTKRLRPEFLNRIDRVVIYRDLDEQSLRKILAREVAGIAAQVRDAAHAEFRLAESGIEFIVNSALATANEVNDDLGAGSPVAEMKRMVVQQLMNGLNRLIGSQNIPAGGCITAWHGGDSGDIQFSVQPQDESETAADPGQQVKKKKLETRNQKVAARLFEIAASVANSLEARKNGAERAVELRRRAADLDLTFVPPAETINILLAAAKAYAGERQFLKAEKCFSKAEEKAQALDDPGKLAFVLDEYASYFEKRRRGKAALRKLKKLTEIRGTEKLHARMGAAMQAARQYSESREQFKSALASLGPNDKAARAILLCKLAESNRSLHYLDTASEYLKEAATALHGVSECEATVQLMEENAAVAYAEERYAEAKNLYEQSLADRQRLGYTEFAQISSSLARLAMCYFSLRQNALAVDLLERSARILRDEQCIRTVDGAGVLKKLSGLYKTQGKVIEAMILADGVEEIESEADCASVPGYIEKFNRAIKHEDAEEWTNAISSYDDLLALIRNSQHEVAPETVAIYGRLHRISLKRKQLEEAALHLTRAEVSLRALFGHNSARTNIQHARDLAEAYWLQGKCHWAEPFFVLACSIAERESVPADQAPLCESFALMLDQMDRHVEALELRSKATKLKRKRKSKASLVCSAALQ